MSNIYVQEPPTEGKVLLETSVGDIEVELAPFLIVVEFLLVQRKL